MLGWLVRRKIAAFEKDFDYDMQYARDMYSASPRAFWKFSKLLALSEHRQDVPCEAWYAAKIAATLAEDCGPCTQLVVTMAERAGVNPETLRAIVTDNEAAMPKDAALGWRTKRCPLRLFSNSLNRALWSSLGLFRLRHSPNCLLRTTK